MDHVVVKILQEFTFVEEDAGWGTAAGLEEVWDTAWVVQMLVWFGFSLLHVGALGGPRRAGHFIGVTEVAVVHHVVDADAAVAVVVVVRRPHGAEGIEGDFVVVA